MNSTTAVDEKALERMRRLRDQANMLCNLALDLNEDAGRLLDLGDFEAAGYVAEALTEAANTLGTLNDTAIALSYSFLNTSRLARGMQATEAVAMQAVIEQHHETYSTLAAMRATKIQRAVIVAGVRESDTCMNCGEPANQTQCDDCATLNAA